MFHAFHFLALARSFCQAQGANTPLGSATINGLAISGTPPYSYAVGSGTPLSAGSTYYVRISAENDVAFTFARPRTLGKWTFS